MIIESIKQNLKCVGKLPYRFQLIAVFHNELLLNYLLLLKWITYSEQYVLCLWNFFHIMGTNTMDETYLSRPRSEF